MSNSTALTIVGDPVQCDKVICRSVSPLDINVGDIVFQKGIGWVRVHAVSPPDFLHSTRKMVVGSVNREFKLLHHLYRKSK